MKDSMIVILFQNTTSHNFNLELNQNISVSSLEKAIDFYKLLPEEFEEKQAILLELTHDE